MHQLPLYTPPLPTSPLTASGPTAPEHPLLFLHPGDGFGPLALPAAPGRALFLGSYGLGADRGRALEEGLHGCAGLCRAVPSPLTASPDLPQALSAFPANPPVHGARPLPPADSQSQSAVPPGRAWRHAARAPVPGRAGVRGGSARRGRQAGGASGKSGARRLTNAAPRTWSKEQKKSPQKNQRCTNAGRGGTSMCSGTCCGPEAGPAPFLWRLRCLWKRPRVKWNETQESPRLARACPGTDNCAFMDVCAQTCSSPRCCRASSSPRCAGSGLLVLEWSESESFVFSYYFYWHPSQLSQGKRYIQECDWCDISL